MTPLAPKTGAGGAGLVCGCYTGPSVRDLARFLTFPGLDMIELRLDTLAGESIDGPDGALACLALRPRAPVIATNRPAREGGKFSGGEKDRFDLLLRAVRAGAEWVDVELGTPPEIIVAARASGAKILLSFHDFDKTPGSGDLEQIARDMGKTQTDAIKIAVYANSDADNLRVLGLIPSARERFGKDLVAFCMGPLGRWSRVACLFLGSPWTYVQTGAGGPAAPGQLTLDETRTALSVLRACA